MPPADNENVDDVANIKTAIATLTLQQAMDIAEFVASYINSVAAAQAQPQARAA